MAITNQGRVDAQESTSTILDAFMRREHLVNSDEPMGTPEAIKFHKEWSNRRAILRDQGYTNVEIFDLWLEAFRASGLTSRDLLINRPENTSQAHRYQDINVQAYNSVADLLEVTRAKVQENPFAMITKNDLMIGLRNDQGY